MNRAALLLPLVLASPALAAKPAGDRVTTRVSVDSVPYSVTVVGGSRVEVARKTTLAYWSIEERDRQRKAVTMATGCKAADELSTTIPKLIAKLDCSDKH